MFGERGAKRIGSCAAPRWFLVHECDHLRQILYFPFRRKYLDMHLVDFFSQLVSFLVCEDFGLALGGFRVPALPYFFEVRDHFSELFQGARHHEHVVSEA